MADKWAARLFCWTDLNESVDAKQLKVLQIELDTSGFFSYFFRMMIPPLTLSPDCRNSPICAFRTLDKLQPSCDAGLNVVCTGPLTESEFFYERIREAEAVRQIRGGV